MSTYEWEAGTLTIPAAQWASFRKGLLTEWNDHQDHVLGSAKTAHKAAVAAGKGKRGKSRTTAMKAAVAKTCGGRTNDWGEFDSRTSGGHDSYDSNRDMFETVSGLLWKGWGKDAKFQSPQKKDLPFVAISKDATLDLGEASVTFRNAGRTMTWDVPENNHACDAAKAHWFAKKLWAAVNRITWTRGTGGEIRGNNEYNEEDEYGHRGGSYVVATYRMKTAAEKKAEALARRSSFSPFYRSSGFNRRY